jgi:acetyltransferase-like isoleucine patch superfamily enzyme
MNRPLKNAFWRVVDPLLLRVRSRLEHLEQVYPSNRFCQDWHKSARFDETVKFYPGSVLVNHSSPDDLQIGSYCGVMGQLVIVAPRGELKLGHHCSVGWGTRIWAQTRIEIGNYVLIAHLVDIHDSNAHSLDPILRRNDPVSVFEENTPMDFTDVPSKPVRIEDDVWIGFKSSIMKGVTVGRGSVIAAGSMVTKDVPPYTLVAGNPARVVRELESVEVAGASNASE